VMNIAAQAARNLGGFVPNKIFIGGVPITCSEEQFRNYFEPFGPISRVELHALRGFGYITYESVESVDACLEKYEDHYLCKKWVEVKRSIPRELIDAYEREQRRLHAEHGVANESDKPVAPIEVHSKVEHAAPAPAPAPAPSAWGSAPSIARRSGPSQNSKATPGMGFGNLSRIAQLKEMGFSDEVAKRVLSECAWDVNAAIDRLLTSGAMPGDEGSSGSAEPQKDDATADTGGREEARATSATSATPATPAASAWTQGSPSKLDTDSKNHLQDHGDKANGYHEKPHASGNIIPAHGASCKVASEITCGEDARDVHEKSALAAQQLTHDTPDNQTNAAVPEVVELVAPEIDEDGSAPMATTNADLPAAEVEEEAATEEQHAGSAESTFADAEGSAPPPPRKRIERVLRSWTAEDPSQLSVVENEFVSVWVGTETDNGWIHAEGHEDGARAGWLPLCVLKTLPEGQRWMRAVQQWQAMDESQCSAAPGDMVIVWVSSRTKEGWTYAESEQDSEMKPGWLPVFCLAWSDE